LVVRVWRQDLASSVFAARISRTLDLRRGFEDIETMAEIDRVCGAVRSWLEQFVTEAMSDRAAWIEGHPTP
jgi:hypothetical protein